MNILFVLVPLSLVLIGLAVWALFWAIDSGQFDNLDEAAHSLQEDDSAPDPLDRS
jgi:cbb3-type cytochrome oxidase maturation protein